MKNKTQTVQTEQNNLLQTSYILLKKANTPNLDFKAWLNY